MKLYFESILMSTHNIPLFIEHQEDFPKLSPFAYWPGALFNPQWLEPPLSRIYLQGPKDVRAIEVLLYKDWV